MNEETQDLILSTSYNSATAFRLYLEELTSALVASGALNKEGLIQILDVCDQHVRDLARGEPIAAIAHDHIYGDFSASVRERLSLPDRDAVQQR